MRTKEERHDLETKRIGRKKRGKVDGQSYQQLGEGTLGKGNHKKEKKQIKVSAKTLLLKARPSFVTMVVEHGPAKIVTGRLYALFGNDARGYIRIFL